MNLAFHSSLRCDMIILPILTTSLIHFSSKGWEKVGYFWAWEWQGKNTPQITSDVDAPSASAVGCLPGVPRACRFQAALACEHRSSKRLYYTSANTARQSVSTTRPQIPSNGQEKEWPVAADSLGRCYFLFMSFAGRGHCSLRELSPRFCRTVWGGNSSNTTGNLPRPHRPLTPDKRKKWSLFWG